MSKNLWKEELDRAQDLWEIMGEDAFLSNQEAKNNCLITVLGLLKNHDTKYIESIISEYPFLEKVRW